MLMEVARNRGLEEIQGEVLSNNHKMLELMKSLGFRISRDPEDQGIKRVVHTL
jgi:acetyltransferase